MWRPRSGRLPFRFLSFCLVKDNRRRRGGNVGIRHRLPDSQEGVETRGNLHLVFAGFHTPAISTALFGFRYSNGIGGRQGDSILQIRNTIAFAAPIFFAKSVSLIVAAVRSSASMLIPGLRYFAAPGRDLSF